MTSQTPSLEKIESTLLEIKEKVDQSLSVLEMDIDSINQSFLNILEEYNNLMSKASQMFKQALEDLDDSDLLVGTVKFVVKGIGAAFNYGKAWFKKKSWEWEFSSKMEELKNARVNVIYTKLANLKILEEKELPYLREKILWTLNQLGSYEPSDTRVLDFAVEKAEEALLLFFKTYFIEGGIAYLKSALNDAKEGKAVVGDASVWKEALTKAPRDLEKKLSELNVKENSAVALVVKNWRERWL
ncbi:hypothetical protein [Phorcysia thermohydrogeniphila]|uniref:Uncharacterized protein n=1 Tax=Phorcysia thermohydrogeniphila TaxID=936138 RepID=A0A4R1G5G0_9BACT|nr:hypothetical protein [Phorcysia thermohydrogeniphila]TCK02854.1 hypothetical protein CLV27_1561 [Phorcysia thermohydrogeniphila]